MQTGGQRPAWLCRANTPTMKVEKENFLFRGKGNKVHRWDAAFRGHAGQPGAAGVQNPEPYPVASSQNRGVFGFGHRCRQRIPLVMLRAWPSCPAGPCGTVPRPLLLQVHGAAESRACCPPVPSESKSACNILFELISLTTRLEWLNIAAAGN